MKKINYIFTILSLFLLLTPLNIHASETEKNIVIYNDGIIKSGEYKEPTRTGYTFDGWYLDKECTDGKEFNPETDVINLKEETTVYAKWVANTDTEYTVIHWTQNIGGDASVEDNVNYSIREIESLEGITDAEIAPEFKTYEGFTSPTTTQTVTVTAEGSTVVNYYYTRNEYTVILTCGEGIDSVSGDGVYKYGEQVIINATVAKGYMWNGWTGTYNTSAQQCTFKMPAEKVENTANALQSGLYDEEGILLASWDELVNTYGMDVEMDYTLEVGDPNAAITCTTSPSYVLNCNDELSAGTKIILPNSVATIGTYAFFECQGLTEVIILEGVTSIRANAFASCRGLVEITIPESVICIEEGALETGESLSNIIVNENNPIYSSENGVLFNKNKTTLITCPPGIGGRYSIPKSVTNIDNYAFAYSLEEISMPYGVVSIGDYAFSSCSRLRDITIPESVASIGTGAFEDCQYLTQVYFKHISVPLFGENCFRKNTGYMCTFYFKNSTVADAFTTDHYNSSYGTKSTDYSW